MYVMSGRDFVKTTEQFLADFYFIGHNYLLLISQLTGIFSATVSSMQYFGINVVILTCYLKGSCVSLKGFMQMKFVRCCIEKKTNLWPEGHPKHIIKYMSSRAYTYISFAEYLHTLSILY